MSTRIVKYRHNVHREAVKASGIDEYTKVMLHFDESTTKDECGNTWTSSGSPTISSIQYKFSKSLQLSGTSKLILSNKIPVTNGTCTIDFWAYVESGDWYIGGENLAQDTPDIQFDRGTECQPNYRGHYIVGSGTRSFTTGWHHFALSIKNRTWYFAIDGIVTSGTESRPSYGVKYFPYRIESSGNGTIYIDELRFSDGIARWTENFTPPTEPYRGTIAAHDEESVDSIKFYDKPALKPNIALNGPSGTHTYAGLVPAKLKKLIQKTRVLPVEDIDSYTKVLLHFDESNTKDECGNAWTATGSPSLSSSPAKFGKALQLNGSSQYLETSNTFSIGSQDWTLDFWIYRNSTGNGYDQICDSANSNGLSIMIRPSNITVERASTSSVANFSYTLPSDSWHHIAIVRDGNNFYLFVDGTKQGTKTDSNAFGNSFTRIGRAVAEVATATYLDGYLDEFRFSLGIARWTEDFTPPVHPYGYVDLSQIDKETNYTTPLALLHFNDPQKPAYDEVIENTWKTINAPVITDEQSKFGKALKLTNGQQVYCEQIALSNSDFTVDFWAYIPTGSSGKIQTHYYEYEWKYDTSYVSAYLAWDNLQMYFQTGSGYIQFDNAQRDSWSHIAIVFAQSSKTYYCYVNGQLTGSSQLSDLAAVRYDTPEGKYTATIPITGGVSNVVLSGECYIDEFRITPEALWEADFTPPTAPMTPEFELIANLAASDIFIHTADEVLAIAKSKKTPTLTVSTDSITLNELGDVAYVTMNTDSDGEFNVWTNDTDLVSIERFGNQFTVEQIREGSGTALVFVQVLEGREYEASEAISINVGTYEWGPLHTHTPEEIQMACRLGIAHNLWSVGDLTSDIAISKFQVGGYFKTVHTGDLSYQKYYRYYIQADENKNEPLQAMLIGINHNKFLETPDVTADVLHFALARKPSGGWNVALVSNYYDREIEYSEYKYAGQPWTILHHRNVTKNEGGWSKSIIRNKLLPKLKDHLPIEWQRVIQPVWKYTDNRTDHDANVMTHNGVSFVVDKSGISSTYDYLFLPSEYEIFGEITHSHPGEAYFQEQYEWICYPSTSRIKYTAPNNESDIYAGKYDCTWWLRSPRLTDKKRFCRVNTAGDSGYKLANFSSGIVPCFVIY